MVGLPRGRPLQRVDEQEAPRRLVARELRPAPGGEKKVSNQGNRSRKTAQRQEAITSTAETRTPERQVEIAEENEVADEGLPYNLL